MSIESNKEIIRRHIKAVNEKTPEVWDEIMSPDYAHNVPGLPAGREGYKQLVHQMWIAFPDLNETLEEIVAEGDKVVIQYTERGTHKGDFVDIPASGRSYEKGGMAIYRMENGLMSGLRVQENMLGWVQQLGIELPKEVLFLA